ncbi:MAG: hypothetical protein P4L35_15010 [Ignavibacteriaceae bacterium]|nr:hypothetical protein [Ignavibacteriaceae bacterium]
MSLAYVDAICRKRKEKADMAKSRERKKKKVHDSMLGTEEERKSGKCLTLGRDVMGGMVEESRERRVKHLFQKHSMNLFEKYFPFEFNLTLCL